MLLFILFYVFWFLEFSFSMFLGTFYLAKKKKKSSLVLFFQLLMHVICLSLADGGGPHYLPSKTWTDGM